MTFYALELDTCPAYGWEGGPNADILIQALRNKHERRNWLDGQLLHTFTLRFQNLRSSEHLEEVKTMFMVMHGPHHTFLCKDYNDFRHGFKADNYAPMPFAVGDGTTTHFQLTKTYSKTVGDVSASFVRDITKPVVDENLVIYVNDVTSEDATVDPLTGDVDFGSNPPPDDAVISWVGEFRCCVRFASFYLPATIDDRFADGEHAVNGSCSLQEVPGE